MNARSPEWFTANRSAFVQSQKFSTSNDLLLVIAKQFMS